jgi:tRNA-specific adenosine deaminase 2
MDTSSTALPQPLDSGPAYMRRAKQPRLDAPEEAAAASYFSPREPCPADKPPALLLPHLRPAATPPKDVRQDCIPEPDTRLPAGVSTPSAPPLASSPHLSNHGQFTAADERMMRVAFEEGKLALGRGEVPVGVVYARHGQVVARAGNETNLACDATRHAELVALEGMRGEDIRDLELYVTVEPCIMCAGALANVKIKKVTFGCSNDKFGGCGSVLSVHDRNTFPHNEDHLGFECRGGLGHDEAVELLREFYARENGKTPKPRPDGTARRVAKRKSRVLSSASDSAGSRQSPPSSASPPSE